MCYDGTLDIETSGRRPAMTEKRTADDFKADMARRNMPSEWGSWSLAESEQIEAGRLAWGSLKKTFELWVTIGKAITVLWEKAERAKAAGGPRKRGMTFKDLLEREGFNMQPATAARLLQIVKPEILPKVVAWHETLTDQQKIDWAGPGSIFNHCPVFKKPKSIDPEAEPVLSPMEKLKQANVLLQEENHCLKQNSGDTEYFKPSDTANDVAQTLLRIFSTSKAEAIARKLLELLKGSDSPKPKRKAKTASE
jgi:hypothetical protein